MMVRDLIGKLADLPPDKMVLCQVVPQQVGGAWNMLFDVHDVERADIVQLRVEHPELQRLPAWSGQQAIPQSEDEAVAMALVSLEWLRVNAPHRLKPGFGA